MLFLASQTGGAHRSTSSLYSIDCDADELKIIVDSLGVPNQDTSFPGLYPETIVSSPFLNFKLPGDTHLVSTSIWGSRSTVVLIDLMNGIVRDLTPVTGRELHSWSVHATNDEQQILCVRSSPLTPPEILHGSIHPETFQVSWTSVCKVLFNHDLALPISQLTSSKLEIPDRHPTEAVILQPRRQASEIPPMILSPHGGPHSTTTTEFNVANVVMALSGYTVVNPNYTGSLGFGQKWVNALLTKCGTLDVQDCISTVNYLITLGLAENGKLFITGGSHGGFLTGHLIGQYPDIFCKAVLRNPVVAPQEPGSTDIPDWYANEFLNPDAYALKSLPRFDEETTHNSPLTLPFPLNPETFEKLYECSVTRYIPSIKTPSLFLIGGRDLRVAPTQGIDLYYALKARGVVTDMLIFPDQGHAIDGVEASRASLVASIDWFQVAQEEG